MPFIGDAVTLAAGVVREPFWRFTLIATLARGGRHILLALATLALI